MMKKADQDFLTSLSDEVKLEKRIQEFVSSRMWNTISAVVLAILTFAHVLFLIVIYKDSISTTNPFGVNIPAPMMLMPAVFFPLLLINAIKAVAAHCEIRMLLLFKKLRDDKSVVTP